MGGSEVKIRPITKEQRAALLSGIYFLKMARARFLTANCPSTLKKVRSAIKSAEGADRHAERRQMHSA